MHRTTHVRFGPIADFSAAKWLFDHFIGASEHDRWECETHCLGGLKINHQLILGRRLHGHLGWLLALEDAIPYGDGLMWQRDVVRAPRTRTQLQTGERSDETLVLAGRSHHTACSSGASAGATVPVQAYPFDRA